MNGVQTCALPISAKDQKAIIEDKVAPNYVSIAENINKIIELEAMIANLEASSIISRKKDAITYFKKEENK